MKKNLSLLLAGAMVVASLAGCGPTPPAAAPAPAGGGDAAATTAAAAGGGDAAAPAAPSADAELNLIIASNQTSLDNP